MRRGILVISLENEQKHLGKEKYSFCYHLSIQRSKILILTTLRGTWSTKRN